MSIDPTNLDPTGIRGFSTTGKPYGFKIRDIGDGSGSGPVEVVTVDTSGNYVAGGGGGGATEAYALYLVTTAGTGYAVGDVLSRIITVTSPTTATSYWVNLTQNTVLSSPPTIANLALQPAISQIVDSVTPTQKLVITSNGAAKTDGTATIQPVSIASTNTAGLNLDGVSAFQAGQYVAGFLYAYNTGSFDRVVCANIGTNLASGTKGSLVIQGSSSGTPIPTSIAAGANAIGSVIGQRPFEASVSITRPANTTAYAVGQVLSTATSGLTGFPTFAVGIGSNQRAIINNVLITSSNGAAGTKGQFSVFLFNVNNPSGGGFNDASTFAPTSAALSASGNGLFGTIPSSIAQAGTAAYGYNLTNDTRQIATDGSGNTFVAIVLNNAYTPASGEVITVRISGVY